MPSAIQNLRGVFSSSYLALPLILYGWSFFMGLTTGNVGLLVLCMGAATVVPLVVWFSNYLLDIILNLIAFKSPFLPDIGRITNNAVIESITTKNYLKQLFGIKNCKGCSIFPPAEECTETMPMYVFPSYWLAEIAFFFAFILSNASAILNMKADENAPKDKVENRKQQARMVFGIAITMFIVIALIRLAILGCETVAGTIYGSVVFGSLAAAWYQVAKSCSMRDSDLFGIVQGILPPNINDQSPMTCVYQG